MGIRTRYETWNVPRARAAVLVAAAAGLLIRMLIAANMRGPADVHIFRGFARAIVQYGPIRIYEQPLPGLPVYNHPPLAGWMLLGLDELSGTGIPFGALIRAPASIADFFCALVVFEIVRRRASLGTAVACGIGVAASPLLIATSGYHGNTDEVAITFALLAGHLLVDRKAPLLAGVAAALAISVKFVPVVVVPALFVVALRAGRPALLRFTAGFTALFALVWGPVLATVPEDLKENVLEYAGGGFRLWGLVRFADLFGLPDSFIAFIEGDGHFLFVLACMAAGVWLAWLRPAQAPVVVGVVMGLLLLLSTASALQYLTWPAAGLFVVGFWPGAAYSCALGVTAVLGYRGRSAVRWNETVLHFAEFGWLVLAAALAVGVRTVLAARPDRPGEPPAGKSRLAAPRTSHPTGSTVN
ncbi:glycosyltransferase family 39 protein [Streptomyces sp. NPDC002431]